MERRGSSFPPLLDSLLEGLDDEGIQAFAFAEGSDGESPVHLRAGSQNESAGIVPVCRRGEGTPVLAIDLDPLIDDAAKLSVDLRFVVPVTAGVDPAGDGPDVTPVFLRPKNKFQVLVAGFHFSDSSIFALTNLI
jgi:hypothetical protein